MSNLSLRLRLLIAAMLVLAVFLGVMHWGGDGSLAEMSIAGSILLLLLLGLGFWLLAPIRRVAEEIEAIKLRRRERLSESHPKELLPLTDNLNAFIHLSDTRLTRYRTRLDDLAHSFKTPLAILRTAAEDGTGDEELRRLVLAQVERMDQAVRYHLKRAATHGQLSVGTQVTVQSVAEKLHKAFAVKYAAKNLVIANEIDRQLLFPGNQADLMEIFGNLGDNACKAARARVQLSAHRDGRSLILQVEDDGPGIPADHREIVLRRGRRDTAYREGSGIGLALVGDIVADGYQGWVEIEDSVLGGACVKAVLPVYI